MDRIIIKCCRECNLQKICKEKYPGKFPPCRDEAVANFSTSTNNRSDVIAEMEKKATGYIQAGYPGTGTQIREWVRQLSTCR